jgi:6-phosphogluconolactonase
LRPAASIASAKEPETLLNRATLLILALAAVVGLSGCGSSKHQFAYVTTPFNDSVTAYRVNSNTGAFKQVLGSPYPTGVSPSAIVVHPSGKFAYVANAGDNTISLYKIGSTGTLTEVMPRSNTGRQPSALAMDSAGTVLFSVNNFDNNISAFAINGGSGALTAASGSPFPTRGFGPLRIAVSPSGKFLYVANSASASVAGFSFDSSGNLTPVPNSPIPVGNGPNWIAFDPAGKFLYVPNIQDGTFSGFSIDANTGALSVMAGSPFGVSTSSTIIPLSSIIVEPSGTYLYVTANNSSNNVYGFSLNTTTGVPTTAITNSPFPGGSLAAFIASDATGKLLFVGNQGTGGTTGAITTFRIAPKDGQLTVLTTTNTGSTPTSIATLK